MISQYDLTERAREHLLFWHGQTQQCAPNALTNAYNALNLIFEWQRAYRQGRATFEAWDAALGAANEALEHMQDLCTPPELRKPPRGVITFESEAAYRAFIDGLRRDFESSLIRTQARINPAWAEQKRAETAARIARTATDEQVLEWAGYS